MGSQNTFPQGRVERALGWWLAIVERAPIAVLFFALLAAGVSLCYTLTHLRLNTNSEDLLSKDLPFRQTQKAFEKAFPQFSDNLLVVVDGNTPDEARDGALRLVRRFAERKDLLKSVYLPEARRFFRENGLLYQDLAELQELADNLARVQPFLSELAADQSLRGLFTLLKRALTEPEEGEDLDLDFAFKRIAAALRADREGRHHRLSWEELMSGKDSSPEDRRAVIVVIPFLDYHSLLPGERAIQAVRTIIQELNLVPETGVRVRLTGDIALEYEELESASLGAQFASLSSFIMVAVLMAIGLRSGWMVFALLSTLLLGLIFTAGFATLAIGELNLISIAFAVMFIGIGDDFATNLCMRYKELSLKTPDHLLALKRAARHVGGSLGLCAIAGAAGFFAFVPTAFAGVAELGIISGAGMFISLFVTLTVLPAILSLRPLSRTQPPRPRMRRLVSALLMLPLRHARLCLGITGVLALLALAAVFRITFDENPINVRDPGAESVIAFKDLLATTDQSAWSMQVLAKDAKSASDIERRLARLKVVDDVVTLADLIPAQQEEKLAVIDELALLLGAELSEIRPEPEAKATENLRAIRDFQRALAGSLEDNPQNRFAGELYTELAMWLDQFNRAEAQTQSQALAALQADLLGSFPGRLQALTESLRAHPIALKDLRKDLREYWLSPDGTYRIEILPKENLQDNGAMRRFVAEVQRIAPAATGLPVINIESSDAIVAAFYQAFLYALAAIVVVLVASMHHKVDALIVLGPLLLSALFTGAATVVLDMPFNFANIIVLPLLLGLGVDYGIHMVHRFHTDLPADGVLLNTSTSKAVVFGALTTIASFGNLAISPHWGMASMGVLLTVGLLITLICTLLVVPSLLLLVYRYGPTKAARHAYQGAE